MAKWIRGRSFGTSMCDNCNYEIPYGVYATEPDPSTCPKCGEKMENGYNTLKTKLEKVFNEHMKLISEEVFPEELTISTKVQTELFDKIFKKYLKNKES